MPATYNPEGDKISLANARKEDSEIYMIQENYVYILGTITLAIVFLGVIVVLKK
jgi:glyoxylate utilization-related uncharacterized protein